MAVMAVMIVLPNFVVSTCTVFSFSFLSVFGGEFRCRRAPHTHSYLACDVRGGTVQWNAKTVLSLFEIEDVRTYILVQIQISNFKFSCARRTSSNKIEHFEHGAWSMERSV